jgi:hypothetical protein
MTRIDQNTVHNWHVKGVRDRIKSQLTEEQQADIAAAHQRHHEAGTSAADEAKEFNRKYGLA